MTLKKSHEIGLIAIGAVFLSHPIFSAFFSEINPWQEMSLRLHIFLFVPIFAAVFSLRLGMKYNRRLTGLVGFLLSAIWIPFFPAIVASLVILYSISKSPLLVTSVWTGITGLISAAPIIHHRFSGIGGDLTYAAGYGWILFISLVSSVIFFGISLTSIIHFYIRAKKTDNL